GSFAFRALDDPVERIPGHDGEDLRRKHIAGVELFGHAMYSDRYCPLTSLHLPKRRHHAPIAGQSPGMDIDAAEPWDSEKLRLEDLRRRDGYDHVRRNRPNPRYVFRPIDRSRPDDGYAHGNGERLDRPMPQPGVDEPQRLTNESAQIVKSMHAAQ